MLKSRSRYHGRPVFQGVEWDDPHAEGLVAFYPELPLTWDRSLTRSHLELTSGTVARTARETINNSVLTVGGGGAIYTDGVPLITRPLTILAWALCTQNTATQDIVSLNTNPSGTGGQRNALQFAGASGGDPIRAAAQDFGGSPGAAVSSTGYTVNQWHHCAAVFTSNTSRAAYIDGGSEGTNTTSITVGNFTRLSIGATWVSSALGAQLSGSVADVRIYNRALSASEIADQFYRPWDLYWQPSNLVYFQIPGGVPSAALSFTGLSAGLRYQINMPDEA